MIFVGVSIFKIAPESMQSGHIKSSSMWSPISMISNLLKTYPKTLFWKRDQLCSRFIKKELWVCVSGQHNFSCFPPERLLSL
jgi:hypothetical protein